MTLIAPRPTLIDAKVKAAYAPVAKWYVAHGGNGQVSREVFEKTLAELFKSGGEDGYRLAKLADDLLKWTAADAELVSIFQTALDAAPKILFDIETEWVTSNGVRVSQSPRDPVLFYVGDQLCHGVVQNILTTRAQVVVALVDSLDQRNRATQMFRLNVEDLIERQNATV